MLTRILRAAFAVRPAFAVNIFVYDTVISRWGGVAWRVGYEDGSVVRVRGVVVRSLVGSLLVARWYMQIRTIIQFFKS